jgi:two-component system NarL family sensor kinase
MDSQYIIAVFLAGTLILVLFALFVMISLIIQKGKQNRYLLEKQQMKFDHEKELMNIELKANEHTMKQISEEIHDNVAQTLFQAELSISLMHKKIQDEETLSSISAVGQLIRKAMGDLRNLSHLLNGLQIQELGLVQSLQRDIKHINQSTSVVCSLELRGLEEQLPGETELLLYRIAQEAIGNALKHAQATSITVELDYTSGQLQLSITDNGKGFDKLQAGAKGLGLLNMRQRAKVLGADFNIESADGAGSKLSLALDIA